MPPPIAPPKPMAPPGAGVGLELGSVGGAPPLIPKTETGAPAGLEALTGQTVPTDVDKPRAHPDVPGLTIAAETLGEPPKDDEAHSFLQHAGALAEDKAAHVDTAAKAAEVMGQSPLEGMREASNRGAQGDIGPSESPVNGMQAAAEQGSKGVVGPAPETQKPDTANPVEKKDPEWLKDAVAEADSMRNAAAQGTPGHIEANLNTPPIAPVTPDLPGPIPLTPPEPVVSGPEPLPVQPTAVGPDAAAPTAEPIPAAEPVPAPEPTPEPAVAAPEPAAPEPTAAPPDAAADAEAQRHVLTEVQLNNLDSLYKEANELLLEVEDLNVLFAVSAARHADNTQLGLQFRRESLTMLENYNPNNPKVAARLAELKTKANQARLALPENTGPNPLVAFLEANRDGLPPGILAAARTGTIDINQGVDTLMNTSPLLGRALYTEVIGRDKKLPFQTAAEIVATSGVANTPENVAHAQHALHPPKAEVMAKESKEKLLKFMQSFGTKEGLLAKGQGLILILMLLTTYIKEADGAGSGGGEGH